jgi:hypothetical protein
MALLASSGIGARNDDDDDEADLKDNEYLRCAARIRCESNIIIMIILFQDKNKSDHLSCVFVLFLIAYSNKMWKNNSSHPPIPFPLHLCDFSSLSLSLFSSLLFSFSFLFLFSLSQRGLYCACRPRLPKGGRRLERRRVAHSPSAVAPRTRYRRFVSARCAR